MCVSYPRDTQCIRNVLLRIRQPVPEVLEDRPVRHEAPAETAEELPAPEHRQGVQTNTARLLDQLTEYLAAQILYIVAGVDHTLRHWDRV